MGVMAACRTVKFRGDKLGRSQITESIPMVIAWQEKRVAASTNYGLGDVTIGGDLRKFGPDPSRRVGVW